MKKILNLSKHMKLKKCFSIPFTKLTFSGGEEHIKIDPLFVDSNDHVMIVNNITSSQEVMSTLMATNALRGFGIKKIDLFTPYFPYARQDRKMIQGEPFSLKVMADLINLQKYDTVHVLDQHSDVTSALVDNINLIDTTKFVKTCWNRIVMDNPKTDLCIVSPDAGAEKKVWKIAKTVEVNNVILGSKHRDVTNGNIKETIIIGDVKYKGCVIFDDIIDGGATFIKMEQLLREKGASKVFLVASHGIFSKGFDVLKMFDKIYITDSFRMVNENNIETIPIESFYDFPSLKKI